MARSGRTKAAIAAIVIVAAAVAVYAFLPYVVSTNVNNLHNGENTYVYGTVEKRYSATNGNSSIGAFELSGSGGNVWVVWNGSMPQDGQKVLVHGTYHKTSLTVFNLQDFKASSVTDWPF